LSSASATTVNSSSDGLSFARSTAGGPVAGFDTLTTGGCVDGLVLACPLAEHDCQDGLSSARSAVVSHTVASARLLASGDMPSSRSPPGLGKDQTRSGQAGVHACNSCCSTFSSLRVLRVHERSRHTADYHAGLAIGHRNGNKRRWGHQEKVLVARQELLLEADMMFGKPLTRCHMNRW